MSEDRPKYVLFVDDTAEVRMVTEALLESDDRHLVVAKTGEEALEMLDLHDYALALLDVHLPGMDGFELAGRIRAHESTKHLPIIFVTAVNMEDEHIFHGYESGAVDYLLRPVHPHILRSKVDVFCDLHDQRERIAEYAAEIEAKNEALEKHLAEIQQLQGLIPICCNCKKVRDDDGFWQQVELYIMERSEARFTHGICQECSKELYGE